MTPLEKSSSAVAKLEEIKFKEDAKSFSYGIEATPHRLRRWDRNSIRHPEVYE